MLNWDDLKFFLAVCRTGSIRGAAVRLNVNHATVSRRIKSFEASIGQRLFERSSKGYEITAAGEEIFKEASHLEASLNTVERKAAGKNQALTGEIRVTMPDMLAQNLLMAGFAQFCLKYPEIELEVVDSTEVFNLANREADVAFRICAEPPDYLIGRKLAVIHRACYMAKSQSSMLQQANWLEQQSWIGWTDKARRPIGKIAREYPRFQSKHKILNGSIQVAACREGLGIAILPCFVGDTDPLLIRVPPYTSEAKYDLWILSHPDLRKSAKIQTFVREMTEFVHSCKPLIEGQNFKYSSLN